MKLIRRSLATHSLPQPKYSAPTSVYLFYEKSTGTAHFHVEAGPSGELPVDHAAGLLAMHCLVRGQSPKDYLVMVPAAPNALNGLTEKAEKLLEAGHSAKNAVRLTRREEEVLDGILRSLANKEIEQIQKGNEQRNHNINPGLGHDFRTSGGERFRYADHPQRSAEGREEQGKHEKGDDLRGRPGFDGEIECDREAKEKSETKEKVRRECRGPHFGAINPGDFDLAVGELEKARKVGLDVGGGEAFGKKNDLAAGSFDGDGEGVVVAESVLPNVQHTHFFEECAANRSATAPAEIFVVAAEHGDNRSIPCGEKKVREGAIVRDKPAHGGGCANAGVGEGGHDVVQPGFSWATVGVNEDEDFEIRG